METFNSDPAFPARIPPTYPPIEASRAQRVLSKIIRIILAIAIFASAICILTFSLLHNSEAARMAMRIANSNDAARSVLGSPIEKGFKITGSVNINGSSGRAELAIPVHGPKGKGALYAFALKRNGKWQMQRLSLRADGAASPLVLVAGTAPECSSDAQ